MKRYVLLLAMLCFAVGCAEDPQARYAEEEHGDVSGEATPPAEELSDDAAYAEYEKQQAQQAQ